jgi:hypothetical protein
MARVSRAYAVAETVTECLGCDKDGRILVDLNDGDSYSIPCPLLDERCPHGANLLDRLDRHAAASVMDIPGVPKMFADCLVSPQLTAAVHGVNRWMYEPKTFLVMHGEHGTGKSFGAAYALYRIARKRLLVNWKYPTMWGPIGAMWLSAYRAVTKDDLFESARLIPLLVIDDMGCEESIPRGRGKLGEIVSARYDQMRPTVITMNADAAKISEIYGHRMADRIISAGHTVRCGGESMRLTA